MSAKDSGGQKKEKTEQQERKKFTALKFFEQELLKGCRRQ